MKSQNVKGKVTDKKIAQIVSDLYMNDPLYPILYRELAKFFDSSNGYDEDSHNKIRTINYDQDGNMVGSSGPNDSFPDLFRSTMQYTEEEQDIYMGLFDRRIKVVDIQKKYGISNVTLKSRLNGYFRRRRVQEGKVGYLGLMLNYDTMLGVALYNYFESKEGVKQSEIIRTFSLLKENK